MPRGDSLVPGWRGLVRMLPEQELEGLLERARRGDAEAVNQLFSRQRPRLRRMVERARAARLCGRADAWAVFRGARLEVSARLPAFLSNPSMPFWVWMRLEVGKHLLLVHRQHLGTAMRDVRREVALH